MNRTEDDILKRTLQRMGIGMLVFAVTLVAGVEIARAAEIAPSYGWMRAVDASESKGYVNLALRGNLLPALQSEIAAGYRNESRFDDQLNIRMWPVTASLWLTPIPALYAGGGVGWYHTTFDYDSSLPIADETHEEFGVHLGGGLKIPLAPSVAADLGGRYVMMRDQESPLIPQKFDPDFWVTSVGLAFHF